MPTKQRRAARAARRGAGAHGSRRRSRRSSTCGSRTRPASSTTWPASKRCGREIARIRTIMRRARDRGRRDAREGARTWLSPKSPRRRTPTPARCVKASSSPPRWRRPSSSASSTACSHRALRQDAAAHQPAVRARRGERGARGRPRAHPGDPADVAPEAVARGRSARAGQVAGRHDPAGDPAQGGRQLGRPRGAVHQGARRHPPALRGHRRHLRRDGQGRGAGRRGEEGRRREVRRRPHEEGDAAVPTAATSASTRTRRCSSTTRCSRGAPASSAPSAASCATASSCGSCRSPRRCCEHEAEEGRPGRGDPGQGHRQARRGRSRVLPRAQQGDRRPSVNIAKKHQKPTKATMQGGIIDKEMPIHVSNVGARVQVVPEADAHRLPDRRRRQEGPRLPQVRGGALMAASTTERPRLRVRYDTRDPARAAGTSSGSANVMQVPRLVKIVVNWASARRRSSSRCSTARSPTSRSSPGRSRSSPGRRSRSPASSSARATRSAPRSRCAATGCGSSTTGW